MGKCAGTKGKARKLECYVKSGAKWTAGKLKSGVERIGSFSGEQGKKHKYAFGLFFLAVIGIAALAGSYFLLTAPVGNPTAVQVTYARTYMLSNGTVLVDNHRAEGTIKCVVQASASALTESLILPAPVGPGDKPTYVPIPYGITGIVLNVYSGSSASGAVLVTSKFAVDSTSYVSTVKAWTDALFTKVVATDNTAQWVLGPTPTVNPTWTIDFDTRAMPNGVYTFQVQVTWGVIYSVVPGKFTVPSVPPSLETSSGKVAFLSFFGIGVDIPIPPEVATALPIVFIIVIVIAVASVLFLKRRG